jgi:hypothetical protein
VPCPIYISLWNQGQESKNKSTATNVTATITSIQSSEGAFPSLYLSFIFNLESSLIGSCDVFGATCQTGMVEALVNLNTTVSTTTAACSNYLRAQREAIVGRGPNDPYLYHHPNIDREKYTRLFGRSPQCSVFANRIAQAGAELFNYTKAGHTLSGNSQVALKPTPLVGCPANVSESDFDLYPGGIHHHIGSGRDWHCWGWCNLHVPELQIIYFADNLGLSKYGYNSTNATRWKSESKLYGPL